MLRDEGAKLGGLRLQRLQSKPFLEYCLLGDTFHLQVPPMVDHPSALEPVKLQHKASRVFQGVFELLHILFQ